MSNDWLPSREQDLVDLLVIWKDTLGSALKRTKFGWLDDECSDIINKIDVFFTARQEYNSVPTRQNKLNKDAKKRDIIVAMRDFANTDIRFNKKMEESERLPLGIKPPDTTPTPAHPPTGQAQGSPAHPGPNLIMLHISMLPDTIHDEKSDYGFRIYYGVMPPGGASVDQAISKGRYLMKEPASGEELPHSRFTRRNKSLFEFSKGDSGKTAYFCIRLENAKGDAGPWGPMVSAVIP